MDSNYQHFVGIDWATVEHEVHAMNAEGKRVSASSFKHSGDGLADLCTWLRNPAHSNAPSRSCCRIFACRDLGTARHHRR